MNIARNTISILLLCISASCSLNASVAASGSEGTTPKATSAPPSAMPTMPAASAVAPATTAPSKTATAPSKTATAPSETPAAPATTAPSETPVAARPEIIHYGKKFAIQSALMHSYGGQERRISLSKSPLTCEDLRARGGRWVSLHEQTIDLSVAPPLRGMKGQSVVVFSFPRLESYPVARGIVSEIIKPLPVSVGGRVKMLIEIDHTGAKDNPHDEVGPKESLRIKGEFDLQDCGVFPTTAEPVPNPQTKLKVEMNAEEIAMQGAILVPSAKGYHLMLTSQAGSCKRDAASDVTLEIRLGLGDVSPKSINVFGGRIFDKAQSDVEESLKGIRVTIPKTLGSPGQKASISVNGSITLPNHDEKIAMKLAGTLSALICAK